MAMFRKSRISATEARIHFGDVMKRAENDETLVVERSGRPKVVIMSIESYERLASASGNSATKQDIPEWQRKLDEASDMLSKNLAGKKIDWDEIIYEMREDRSRQLLENMGYGELSDE